MQSSVDRDTGNKVMCVLACIFVALNCKLVTKYITII